MLSDAQVLWRVSCQSLPDIEGLQAADFCLVRNAENRPAIVQGTVDGMPLSPPAAPQEAAKVPTHQGARNLVTNRCGRRHPPVHFSIKEASGAQSGEDNRLSGLFATGHQERGFVSEVEGPQSQDRPVQMDRPAGFEAGVA